MIPLLETDAITYTYPNGPAALTGVSVRIAAGSKTAIVGPNGAGKSTLLLMLNGMLRPASGEVRFNDRPLAYDNRSLRDLRRRVGFVFQNPDVQIIAPTVEADVAFGPVNLGLSPDAVRRAVRDALGYVGLHGYEKRPPHHLSGGEKKRVAIAGILAMEPAVLVFDEPTNTLDPASSEEVMELLDELASGGRTVLISTHDVELAYRWADSVILMERGRVLARGPPEEVFSDHSLLAAARLKPPALLDLYNELGLRGVIDRGVPPKNVLEFTDRIERELRGHTPTRDEVGTIYLCNADRIGGDELRALVEQGAVEHIGAMGTRAKEFANRERILLDYTYGVIDKCILKALIGENSLIITTGGMVEHVHRRIGEYSAESGRALEATPVRDLVEPRPDREGVLE
ncbi:ATP-binding cassette domain-containing protein [Methanoculleus sp.]|uniref:energy-coupling factor ABC transporter ATP-binding protein n=3 Tax=unclassified Methanoculleus TaxID=2619537 RepID=UPI0025FCDCEF|nr:ATP-binding cassette domain-containing protein [Methanoculleus sp.]MCK9318753.1 ATP-binding cassette domain-containing protein [Methanoculleus sp.]MDD2254643.1 ATP-binding cassette domain-containing protein [Methanoculleus sp.]MDD2788730.1 ATP-binding cassette domain-containing protein [Methanoculleus sp.]MDD3216827.1 ATP-binding cassette domain-containing protein [Methanoculleus sp.]MDD4315179.1 ATP-binding cassette domain-containing protein [Methanoculleus sp.]